MAESDNPVPTIADLIADRYSSDSDASMEIHDPHPSDNPISVLDEQDPIFANKEMLEISYVPDPGQIVGSDAEIEAVAKRARPAQRGQSGNSMHLTGKSGSGKTLVTKFVIREVLSRAQSQGYDIGDAFIDCSQKRTETQTVKSIAKVLNNPQQSGVEIPTGGISTNDYYDRLWDIIDELYDGVVIVLDEIDRLTPPRMEQTDTPPEEHDDSKVLFQLSRAREERDIESGLTLISISNDLKYGERLDTRVNSSFNPDEIVFSPYNADQLGDILNQRQEAFRDGVLDDGVIPLAAAFSAQVHGDARKALDLFREAGEAAKKREDEQVTEDHVRDANVNVEVSKVRELLSGVPIKVSLAIAAIAVLDEVTDRNKFKSKEVFEVYERFAEETDVEPVGHRRLTDLLREYETLRILGFDRVPFGQGDGTHIVINPLESPEIMLRSAGVDTRISDISVGPETRKWMRNLVNTDPA